MRVFYSRGDNTVQLQKLYDGESYCLILPADLKSAIAAVTFMAEQFKKQDTDDAVSWHTNTHEHKYIHMP